MNDESVIENRIDSMLDDLPTVLGVERMGKRNKRQILNVENVVYFSAGYVASSANPTPRSQGYLQLTGTPSPSSDVSQGFIRFVLTADIQAPSYRGGVINLWVDQAYLNLTLEQIKHTNRYLWWGEFAGGHVYSDLHTSP